MATLTDLLVSVVNFYAFYKLHKGGNKDRSIFFFKFFFLCMGFSTLIGGIIGHGFLYLFSFEWKLPGWIIGMSSVAFMERGAIMQSKHIMKPSINKVLAFLNILELAVFIVVAFLTLNFFWVEVHATYGMMVVFVLEIYIRRRRKDEASRIIMYSVGVSAIAAFIHVGKFSPHPWFNYLDLSHIFMAAASYLFYLGAKKHDVHGNGHAA